MYDDIVKIHRNKVCILVEAKNNVHEMPECHLCPKDGKGGGTRYCQWLDVVEVVVLGQVSGIRATCQYPFVESQVKMKQALPRWLISSSSLGRS